MARSSPVLEALMSVALPRLGALVPARAVQRVQNSIPLGTIKRPRAGGAVSGPPSLLGKAGLPAWGLDLNVGSTGSESVNRVFVPGQKVAASGEQRRACLGELHVAAALVQPEPALGDGAIQPSLVLGRRALKLI